MVFHQSNTQVWPNDSGVYLMCNNWTGKSYVGSTGCFKRRWMRHIRRLTTNKHANKHMLSSTLKYGINKWDFRILELCTKENRLEKEGKWALVFGDYNMSYIHKDTFTDHPNARKVVKIDTKTLEIIKTYTSISKAVQDNPGCYDGHISRCCKRKQRTHNKFYWAYHEDRNHFQPMVMKKWKRSTKEQSLINLQKAHEKLKKDHPRGVQTIVEIEGKYITFCSISEASRTLNISTSTIINKMKSGEMYEGFTFKRVLK